MKLATLGMLALAAMLVATGCGGATGTLKTGTVDTTMLVQTDPSYQEMAAAYAKERVKLETEINKRVKQVGGPSNLSQADVNKFREKNAELNKVWAKKTDDFLKARFDRIKDATAAVCQDKGIDLVLVDSEGVPTVEYGAVKITQDVELKLQQTQPKKK